MLLFPLPDTPRRMMTAGDDGNGGRTRGEPEGKGVVVEEGVGSGRDGWSNVEDIADVPVVSALCSSRGEELSSVCFISSSEVAIIVLCCIAGHASGTTYSHDNSR